MIAEFFKNIQAAESKLADPDSQLAVKDNEILLLLFHHQNPSSLNLSKIVCGQLHQLSKGENKHFHSLLGKNKLDFVLGRLLLRFALSCYGIDPNDMKIHERPGLSPLVTLADKQGIKFSISHSRDLVALAITKFPHKNTDSENGEFKLGLDIEFMKTVRDYSDIDYFCNDSQQQAIENSPDNTEKTKRYYRYWTQKEAAIKASLSSVGSNALKSLSFSPATSNQSIDRIHPTTFSGVFKQYQCALYWQPAPAEGIAAINVERVGLDSNGEFSIIEETPIDWHSYYQID